MILFGTVLILAPVHAGLVLCSAMMADDSPERRTPAKVARGADGASGAGVANLPDAHGRRFGTLDEYLRHLEKVAAPMDRPWYREVRPGVFRRETGNLRTGAPPRLFTRGELERLLGFRR